MDEKTIGGIFGGILAIGAVVLGYFKRKNGTGNSNGNGKVSVNTQLLISIDGKLDKLEHIDSGIEQMRLEFAELKGRLQ